MIPVSEGARVTLLLVEDDAGDVMITREALAEAKVLHDLHVVDNGESAVAFLRKEGEYRTAPTPDLVFLDLNLPRLSGREVLQIVKGDEVLRHIPVVVLTTSDREEDVRGSYASYANAYVTKPVDLEAFLRVVREIDDFFVVIARLPHNGA